MNLFILNLILAVGFSIITTRYTLTGISAGFAIGYLALWVTRPLYDQPEYFQRVHRALILIVYFVYSLFASGLRVFWNVIALPGDTRPGIVAVPLTAESDIEIMLVANLISLTPGTLSLEVSADRRWLFVHFMFLESREAAVKEIKNGIERKVLEVVR